jgi:hypothetical protein
LRGQRTVKRRRRAAVGSAARRCRCGCSRTPRWRCPCPRSARPPQGARGGSLQIWPCAPCARPRRASQTTSHATAAALRCAQSGRSRLTRGSIRSRWTTCGCCRRTTGRLEHRSRGGRGRTKGDTAPWASRGRAGRAAANATTKPIATLEAGCVWGKVRGQSFGWDVSIPSSPVVHAPAGFREITARLV